ncbi:MAG: hypothetical protein ACERJ1_12770 [Halodesulfovibrio sp.]|uniref:hypothetical protein n=1 Tax=Halodesulfovibrio sp. TaxID=1912772 RepID=UPI00359D5766
MKTIRDELIADIKNSEVSDIYSRYLKSHEVWLFKHMMKVDDPHKFFDQLKQYIQDQLGIHSANIAIAGSAKTGFSFSPKKDFKQFDESSDLDVILVDSSRFNDSWSALLDLKYRGKLSNTKHLSFNIFRRFVSLKNEDYDHSYFNDWFKLTNSFKKDFQTAFEIESDFTYRIYDSWDSVDRYHLAGIAALKESLIGD